MRKPVREIADELLSWLPNFDHGPREFPTLMFQILASLPGGDELEDLGYATYNLGWAEADLLARTIDAVETKGDVEDLVAALLDEVEDD